MPAEENPGTRGVLLVSLGTPDSPSVADVRCYLDEWCRTCQSRLGPKQWLQPCTSGQLALLAKAGAGSEQLVCPGCSADCLETLEEIAMENRAVFLGAGGESYDCIPCFNDHPAHINLFAELVMGYMQDRIS
jgi:ferrochelatase